MEGQMGDEQPWQSAARLLHGSSQSRIASVACAGSPVLMQRRQDMVRQSEVAHGREVRLNVAEVRLKEAEVWQFGEVRLCGQARQCGRVLRQCSSGCEQARDEQSTVAARSEARPSECGRGVTGVSRRSTSKALRQRGVRQG
eukprot:1137654-Pelagomonas_calceolata.AAC.4